MVPHVDQPEAHGLTKSRGNVGFFQQSQSRNLGQQTCCRETSLQWSPCLLENLCKACKDRPHRFSEMIFMDALMPNYFPWNFSIGSSQPPFWGQWWARHSASQCSRHGCKWHHFPLNGFGFPMDLPNQLWTETMDIWAIVKTLGSRKRHPQIWEGPIAYHTFIQ